MKNHPLEDARLRAPSEAAQAEIKNIVSKALGTASVTIAPDSLTNRSTLIIDPPSMGNMDVSGRSTARPDHFDIKTDGRSCYLVHRQTGTRYTLKLAQCYAAA